MEIDFSKSSEYIKYAIPAIGVLLTLLIPKVWDWWRESTKNRYENRKVLKKSLFHLLRIYTTISECKYYLSIKGFKVDYGMWVTLGEFQEQDKTDVVMFQILDYYKTTLNQITDELNKTCLELASVEPIIAGQLSLTKMESSNTGEMQKHFQPLFSIERSLQEIEGFLNRISMLCEQLSLKLDRNTRNETRLYLDTLKQLIIERIKSFENSKGKKEIENNEAIEQITKTNKN